MADGSVTFSTALDNKQLEKELASLTKKIEKDERTVAELQEKLDQTKKSSVLSAAELDAEKAKLQELKAQLTEIKAVAADKSLGPGVREEAKAQLPDAKEELSDQRERVRLLQAEYNKLYGDVKRYETKLSQTAARLDENKQRAGDIVDELYEAGDAGGMLSDAMDDAGKRLEKFQKRIAGLIKRVFVFTLITSALRGMRTWLGNVIQTNDEAASALARLKGALLTLAQPLVSAVIPAFTAFLNILTRIAAAAAGLTSMLFGKTVDQSKAAAEALNNEAASVEAVGSAAKESSKFLSAFDEINQMPENTSAGGASGATAPDFSFDTSTMETDMEKLLTWIKLIGSALLAWKFSNSFSGGLKTFLGLLLAVTGAIELAKGMWDAWQNGADWDNFLQMLGGAALLVAGLGIAFGAMGASIGLLAAGIAFLATGFHDAAENGWNLQNMLMSIMGIMATGFGISLLTGSIIPALIASIAAVVLVLADATGHADELISGVQQVCQGFVDFITGVFSGDIGKALDGVNQMFDGLGLVVGAVFNSVRDTILSFLDWLDEKTGGRLHGIIEGVKGFITGFFDSMRDSWMAVVGDLKDIFSGLVEFVAGVLTNDWDRAWNGLKSIFKGVWNGMMDIAEAAINAIISGINGIGFGPVPDWVPLIGGKNFRLNLKPVQLPRLATGAVIPPNREFMAVLGDQRSGNNIEAPEGLIRQIFREESNSDMNTALLRAILEAVREGQVIVVDKRILGKVTKEALSDSARASGTSMIPV